jgi:hypothetical protein
MHVVIRSSSGQGASDLFDALAAVDAPAVSEGVRILHF